MKPSAPPREAKRFEIEKYRPPKDHRALRQTHVSFSGSLRRHPFEREKVILIVDPYSGDSLFYEFNTEEIGYAEELPSLATPEGESITMVRIWVKKGSIGVRSIPFVVEAIRR